MKTRVLKTMAAVAAMVVLAGCSQNQVLATLEASVAATETVVEALSVSGQIPPLAAAAITGAIAQLPAAYKQTTAELASADSNAVKAVKIAGYYAATLTALQGVPGPAKIYATAIVNSIEAFLTKLAEVSGQSGHAQARVQAASKLDPKELHAIDSRAEALGQRLAALQAAQAK